LKQIIKDLYQIYLGQKIGINNLSNKKALSTARLQPMRGSFTKKPASWEKQVESGRKVFLMLLKHYGVFSILYFLMKF